MPSLLMTYPCYVVVRADGWPDCIRTPGGRALALFTDEDLAERYCKAKREALRALNEQQSRMNNLLLNWCEAMEKELGQDDRWGLFGDDGDGDEDEAI